MTNKDDETAHRLQYFGNVAQLEFIYRSGDSIKKPFKRGPLTLTEMENDYALGNTEWDVLKKYKLSKRQSECMYLYYWGYTDNEPMTQCEIALCFGICRRSVRTHLKRALKKIKRGVNK